MSMQIVSKVFVQSLHGNVISICFILLNSYFKTLICHDGMTRIPQDNTVLKNFCFKFLMAVYCFCEKTIVKIFGAWDRFGIS